MLSFAPFFYRNVFAEKGGPIQRTENAGTLEMPGHVETQLNACLKPELAAGKMSHAVYGSADGTGSSENPAVARHKAISEALERWAFLATQRSAEKGKYGFEHDRSSNGMAAFPGLKFQARSAAYYEALERWALIGWWAGHLDAPRHELPGYENMGAVRIDHGRPEEVVILYRKTESGFVSYGHAAGRTLPSAAAKSAVVVAAREFVHGRHR